MLYPNLEYTLNFISGPLDRLDTDEFDMLLYPRDPMFKKYKGFTAAVDRYYLAVPVLNHLSSKKAIAISELSNEKFVFFKYGPRSIEKPYHLCAALGIVPSISCFTNNNESHRQLIASGLGLGFVTESGSEAFKNDPNISLIPIQDEEFYQEIMIGFKRDKHLSETGKLFRNFVMKHFGFNDSSE